MEEKRIVGSRVVNEPAHRSDDVVLGRVFSGVRLVVGQDYHIIPLVVVALVEESRHILSIVDTSSQLALLSKVVDSNQQSLALSSTVGVLKGVSLRSTLTEVLRRCGRGRAGATTLATISWSRTMNLLNRVSVRIDILGRRSVWRRILVVASSVRRSISGTGRWRTATAAVAWRRVRRAAITTWRRSLVVSLVVALVVITTGATAAVVASRRLSDMLSVAAAEAASAAGVVGCAVVSLAGEARHDESNWGGSNATCEMAMSSKGEVDGRKMKTIGQWRKTRLRKVQRDRRMHSVALSRQLMRGNRAGQIQVVSRRDVPTQRPRNKAWRLIN